jgi:transposase InsO family protein
MPRVRAELMDQGIAVSRKRVARLMRRASIRGVSRRRGFVVTTRRDADNKTAPDLENRQFSADGPNRLWVADMTYVPTWAGFILLAVVLDVWSRRIVGLGHRRTMTADLVLAALNMALEQRKPKAQVVHHSDQGRQYTAIEFGKRCKEMGVRPSMGTVGDAYDNAMAESFRQPRMRADRPANFPDQDRSAPGVVHLHRGLVQPAPPSQSARLPLARQLRKEPSRRKPHVAIERPTRLDRRRRLRGMRHAAGGQVCAAAHRTRFLRLRRQPVRETGSRPSWQQALGSPSRRAVARPAPASA